MSFSNLKFDTKSITECDDIEALQKAGIMAIESRQVAENLVIGKISKLREIISKKPMEILKSLGPLSKEYQTQQILRMMGTDSDPIVVIDEAGSMAAIKLGEDGNITAATKPSWVDSITLFRKTVLKFFYIYNFSV